MNLIQRLDIVSKYRIHGAQISKTWAHIIFEVSWFHIIFMQIQDLYIKYFISAFSFIPYN
jgi:hypothetical protein